LAGFDWKTVDGWLSNEEGKALQSLAAAQDVLEIGAFHGRSTCCLAAVARLVISVDWHRGDDRVGNVRTLSKLMANIEAAGVRDRVIPIVGRVEQVSKFLADSKYGLVFIDDDHGNTVGESTYLAMEAVAPHGAIAWHDADIPAVAKMIHMVAGDRKVHRAGSLAWVYGGKR
jgi:predicted O-methyltransferase YrrM